MTTATIDENNVRLAYRVPCPETRDLSHAAEGLCGPKFERHVRSHAAQCESCGPKLRAFDDAERRGAARSRFGNPLRKLRIPRVPESSETESHPGYFRLP